MTKIANRTNSSGFNALPAGYCDADPSNDSLVFKVWDKAQAIGVNWKTELPGNDGSEHHLKV